MADKNDSFQRLKPACIALSQATLDFSTHSKGGQQVTSHLQSLFNVLKDIGKRPDGLDSKLADYVFFPISQVLKESRRLPVRSTEVCLQCLAVLICQGWRENIASSLSSQLLIFLSLICDTSGKTIAVPQVTDELRASAFTCLCRLFEALSESANGKTTLIDTANVPSLGHAISVILEGALSGESLEVQDAAMNALSSLVVCIEDRHTLSTFFPGIVSTLTKITTPSTQSRRHWRVIEHSLQTLERLFRVLLSGPPVSDDGSNDIGDKGSGKGTPNELSSSSWVQATASQIKLALANINRQWSHSREEVREALFSVNLTILADCDDALANCIPMALQTILMLMEAQPSNTGKIKLEMLMQTKPKLAETLSGVYHDGLLSLTRVMQFNDDQAKERTLGQTFTAFDILARTDTDTRMLSRMLCGGLRDSVIELLRRNDRSTGSVEHPQKGVAVLMEDSLISQDTTKMSFGSPIVYHKSQAAMLDYIEKHILALKQANPSVGFASEFVQGLDFAQGDAQVALFWLALREIESQNASDDLVNNFLAFEPEAKDEAMAVREQLYAFSLDTLESDDADWRLKALALEGIALHAKYHGPGFRGELVDALYPILHHLGSEIGSVQSHAMTCLNVVSKACDYTDVRDLIVSNVDYLVNAVALKLNAFDVSPQGPQVLLMMIRLSGPSLLPYLEDTLESIFAALEDYHGYPALVELLFAVLKTMAEEGAKSPLLAIEFRKESAPKSTSTWTPTSMEDLATLLRRNKARASEDVVSGPEAVPQEPWSSTVSAEARTEPSTIGEDSLEDDSPDAAGAVEQAPPPSPQPYNLLLRITQLTQHYLSSSSPSLRISLLSLIHTTTPALAKHENSYLPLINLLWPEVTSRLGDAEPQVVAGSLQIMAAMCEHAGEFMRSRIAALWPELVSLNRRLLKEVGAAGLGRAVGDGTLRLASAAAAAAAAARVGYVDMTTRHLWESLTELLVVVVKYVGVDAEMFDDVLRLLGPLESLDSDARAALEDYNADAVWLARYREQPGAVMQQKRPESQWQFVQLVG